MRPHRILACIEIVLLFSAVLAHGQQQPLTGTPAFNSFQQFPGGIVINLGSLDVHLAVPILSKAGRGTPFAANWNYDNNLWTPGAPWSASTGLGVFFGVPVFPGSPAQYTVSQVICNGPTYIWNHFSYTDSGGTKHIFPNAQVDYPSCGPVGQTATDTSADGYTLNVAVNGNTLAVSSTVTTPAGTVLNGTSGTGTGTMQDRNGNQITVGRPQNNTYNYTDTLNSFVLQTVFGSTNSTYTYASESNTNGCPTGLSPCETITETYTNYYIASAFAASCSGTTDYVATTQSALPTKFALPDGSSYLLTWEQTPGKSSAYSTGRIASITLPTGGKYTFSYNASNNGMNCDGTTSGMIVAMPDGTWTYTHTTANSNGVSTTNVTDPINETMYYSFYNNPSLGPLEIYRYGNSAPDSIVTTCYDGQTTSCSTAPQSFGQLSQITRYVQPTGNGIEYETNQLFNTTNQLMIEQDDYDFGQSLNTPGPLLRKTVIHYGSGSAGSSNCSALGNNIQVLPCYVIVYDGNGVQSAATYYTYDQDITSLQPSNASQHVNPSGSRGNITAVAQWVSGQSYLTQHFTHYDTGLVYQKTDVNQDVYTYTYGYCDSGFPSSINLPAGLSESMAWSCAGGVETSFTDVNSNTAYTYYSNEHFWQPSSSKDFMGNTTTYSYTPNTFLRSMNFNSSTDTVLTTLDSLGRPQIVQKQQAPGSSNYDSVATYYDTNGLVYDTTEPYSGTASQLPTNPVIAAAYSYDHMNRVTQITTGSGATITYAYGGTGVNKTITPAPSGESAKSWNYLYDGLGRLDAVGESSGNANDSSVCKVSTWNNTYTVTGPCTSYSYNVLGEVTGVDEAFNSSSPQTRSYTYDGLGRPISESNPESGTMTYTYDTSSAGDLATKKDAYGNTISYSYNAALHRLTDATFGTTACRHFVYDQTHAIPGALNVNGRLAYAYTDKCGGSAITQEYFGYDADGRQTDLWETTPDSGPAPSYHVKSQFYANGSENTLLAYKNGDVLITGIPAITYGVDGEGRPTTVSASTGVYPVTAASYNVAGQLTNATLGSGDSDTYSYDSVFRMTGYTFSVNGSNDSGTLTWNANGTLRGLNISDGLYSGGTQNCSYGYDGVMRLTSVNCGSTWSQNFTYDDFGNLSKSGSLAFNPGYNPATNRYTSLPNLSYDLDGHLLNDSFNNYTWSVFDEMLTVQPDSGGNTISVIYDAFGRAVEFKNGSTIREFLFSPTGAKIARMYGQSLSVGHVPLTTGGTAEYHSGGLDDYTHVDWLGTTRFSSNPDRTLNWDNAVAPFGEIYDQDIPYGNGSGYQFTSGQFSEVKGDSILWDFPAREYHSSQGRWITPDPAGQAAVNPMNPQTWNRYAYVGGNPLIATDPLGLECNGITGSLAPPGSINATISITVSQPCDGDGMPAWASLVYQGVYSIASWVSFECGIGWCNPFSHSNSSSGNSSTTTSTAANNGRNCTVRPATTAQYVAAAAQVVAMTDEFFSGQGPGNLTFSPDSATSQVMAQSGPVRDVLNNYYMTGNTSGLYTFGAPGLVSAGGNPVAQFVGSFRWSITPGNGSITLSLTNTTSFKSLTYDKGPQWQRDRFHLPMGNTYQTYNITAICN